jgi:quercetin dioxygenase-like cupin family protein
LGHARIVTNVLEILSRDPELLVMEQSYEAGAEPPPPHYHPSQDEHFEVLEGSIALRVGHEHRTVAAGESFDIPRGTVHTMGPAGGPARVRWEVRPALRTEAFLTEMPEEFSERLGHIQRYAEEFRLAGF